VFSPHKSTVPIFNGDQNVPDLIASGIYVVVDEIKLIITAAHMFEQTHFRLGFGFPGETFFTYFADDLDNIKNPDKVVGMLVLCAAQHTEGPEEYKDGLDIAIIEPTPAIVAALEKFYTPYDLRKNAPPEKPEISLVCGWPCRKNAYDPKKRAANFENWLPIPCDILEREEVRKIGGIPDVHMALRLDKRKGYTSRETGHPIQLPNLHGMSGCGVWFTTLEDSESDPIGVQALAGMIIEDHTDKKMAKVVRVEHLWTPIRRGWPVS
jgi:hypothetical protein